MSILQKGASHNRPWQPTGFIPPLRTIDWKNILSDPEFFSVEELQMMRRMSDIGEPATPAELAERYGACPSFYRDIADEIGLDAASVIKRKIDFDSDTYGYWPIWLEGQLVEVAPKDTPHRKNYCNDVYRWRMRHEIRLALAETDLSHIELHSPSETDAERLIRLKDQEETRCAVLDEQKFQEMQKRNKDKKDIEHTLSILRYGAIIGGLLLAALQIWLANRA